MKARLLVFLVALVALLVCQQPTRAQGFTQISFNSFTSNVTLTTTSETVILSSGPAIAPRQGVSVCVFAWAQLTTGTNTTAVTPRIRRGTTTGGTLVGEANAEQVKAAAGSTEQFFILECEDRADVATVDYSLTLQQTGASADGSALHGSILVFVR